MVSKAVRVEYRGRVSSVVPLGIHTANDSQFDEPDFVSDYNQQETGDASEQPRRDKYIDRAKEQLLIFFEANSESLFYQRQLLVMFEDDFFHWITTRALTELVSEQKLSSETELLPQGTATPSGFITLYRANSYRYWKREAAEIAKLVAAFSSPDFTSALGSHGELMFDAALPTVGFLPRGRNIQAYNGFNWNESRHDLDRVFERDGIAYGTEIKNKLGYIEKQELDIKLKMCRMLKLRPLFIMRMAPKSYIDLIRQSGGFALIFKFQLYPLGQKALADEVRTRLRLPTDTPSRVADGTVQRFLKWHKRSLLGG